MFGKTFLFLFIISALSFSQILYSETFPFQNINPKMDAKKIYELILNQELFKSMELENYLRDHENIAILPVDIDYIKPIQATSSRGLKTIELLSSKCVYRELIRDFKNFSRNVISMQYSIQNKASKKHIPQTEIDRYLDEQDQNKIKKHNADIQDMNSTIEKLNTLKKPGVYNYTPEFLCAFLDVDAIIYTYIYSDVLMPLKDCFSLELLAEFDF